MQGEGVHIEFSITGLSKDALAALFTNRFQRQLEVFGECPPTPLAEILRAHYLCTGHPTITHQQEEGHQ